MSPGLSSDQINTDIHEKSTLHTGITMQRTLSNIWREDDGVLAFEWTLLVTVLTIGIVTGVAAARDGIVDELADVAQAMLAVDQSYSVSFGLDVLVHTSEGSSPSDSRFTDALLYTDCDRYVVDLFQAQNAVFDNEEGIEF